MECAATAIILHNSSPAASNLPEAQGYSKLAISTTADNILSEKQVTTPLSQALV